ncbi:hypothetical protein BDF20DRAFT_832802 [Mycotypha africana]|uniref:uncharacterized protein n=1 Tax=Mycotypha africana TaxID=64632 RepID=UPI002300A35A|nr:uncharacterized protein BDF20DRAFT_832802 [Mycotypha africana]KAI8987918.1 hypothetical protein BDF20DRAFT_832802 [Mycotypha africana]
MSTATSSTFKPATFTLPHIYTPLPTSSTSDSRNTEPPDGVTLKLFPTTTTAEQTATVSTDNSNTAVNTNNNDNADLPKHFSKLTSRAPNEITRTTLMPWTTSSSQITASASASVRHFSKNDHRLDGGHIAGAVIGSVVGALLIGYIFYVLCWSRQKTLRRAREERRARQPWEKMENAQQKSRMMSMRVPRSQPQYSHNRVDSAALHDSEEDDKSSYDSPKRLSPAMKFEAVDVQNPYYQQQFFTDPRDSFAPQPFFPTTPQPFAPGTWNNNYAYSNSSGRLY